MVKRHKTQIRTNFCYEGESIEEKMRRVMATGEPIEAEANVIYQERNDGVDAGCDIRTDRFDIALEGANAMARTYIAARDNKTDLKKAVEEVNKEFTDVTP